MKKLILSILVCLLLTLSLAALMIVKTSIPNRDIPVYSERGKASASTVSDGSIITDITDIIIDKTDANADDYTYIPSSSEYDNNDDIEEEDNMTDVWFPATEMDLDPNSITVFVNKEYGLPKDFVPKDLVVPDIPFDISGFSERKLLRKEAARALEKLFAAALKEGYTLYGISGYRSYERQKEIFLNNLIKTGKNHTLKYSAAPGTSEHQTGLAMDVSSKAVRLKLVTAFAKCPEGKWLAKHAHEFGFIIRYPKDRTEITGYAYEPWHIRYVGKDLANYLYTNNMTLDEYYNYVKSEDFDYEEKYADLLNYKPPVTPTPTPEPDDEEDDDILSEDMQDTVPEGNPTDPSQEAPDDSSGNNPEDIQENPSTENPADTPDELSTEKPKDEQGDLPAEEPKDKQDGLSKEKSKVKQENLPAEKPKVKQETFPTQNDLPKEDSGDDNIILPEENDPNEFIEVGLISDTDIQVS